MPHLVRWNEELGDFGLVVIGPHVQKATPEEITAKARSLRVNFAVVNGGRVEGGTDFNGIPHCMLFDHTGKCLFRGSPTSVESLVRAAVGRSLVAGLEKPPLTRAVASLVESLRKGQSPAAVLAKAVSLQRSPDQTAAEEAKDLVARLTETGRQRVEQAEALRKDDPLAAYGKLERVPTAFKGSPVAAKASTLLAELKKDKALTAELKARPSLATLQQLDAQLSARAGKADPKDPAFQRVHAGTLRQMKTTLQQMKKSWPDAKATAEATAIADKYGVIVK
jgi:hypothetical protein